MQNTAIRCAALGLTLALLTGVADAQGNGKWTGTITMFAQAYTPNSTAPNAAQYHALQDVATAYENAHPGIKIQFQEVAPGGDWTQIVRAKAAAGEMWDVFWSNSNDLNNVFPQGIAVNLKPYFAQKNPYVPGAKTWADAMNKNVIAQTSTPKGEIYNINGDYVATAFYYNKELFKKAGIKTIPRTWNDLVADAKKLKAAGIYAAVGVPLFGWMDRHFLSDYYSKTFNTMANYDKVPGTMSALDTAVAIKKGILSTKDPRFMSWWPLFKTFTDTWVPDYLTAGYASTSNDYADFIAGKAAMFYSGSWVTGWLRRDKQPLSAFNFPIIGNASIYSTGIDVSNQVGGPNAAYQYAIATPKADKTMSQPGKFAAVLDWLRYIGTPQNSEKVINEVGSFVPTWPGTKALSGTEIIADQAKLKLRVVDVGAFAPKVGDELQKIFAAYLSNNINLDQATQQVQTALDQGVAAYEQVNGTIDLAKYQ